MNGKQAKKERRIEERVKNLEQWAVAVGVEMEKLFKNQLILKQQMAGVGQAPAAKIEIFSDIPADIGRAILD